MSIRLVSGAEPRLVSGVEPPAKNNDNTQGCGTGKEQRPYSPLAFKGRLDLIDILEPFHWVLHHAFTGDLSLRGKQQGDHLAQRPDVGPIVHGGSCEEFRSGVAFCSSRALEDRPGICVGKAEVNEFHVVPVVGDENIGGLEVPVDNLLGVEVRKGVTKLESDLSQGGFAGVTLGEEIRQGDSIHPFHLDTVSESRNIPEVIYFTDCCVGEAVADLIFLPEEGFVTSLSSEGRLQGFENPETSVLVDEPGLGPTALGTVDEVRPFDSAQGPLVERIQVPVGERIRTTVGERSRTMVGERIRTTVGERSRTMVGERSRTTVGEKCGVFWHESKVSDFS